MYRGRSVTVKFLVVTFEKLRAVRWDATGRDEGLILVSAGYVHPCLFEDLIFPTRNLKILNSVRYRFNLC